MLSVQFCCGLKVTRNAGKINESASSAHLVIAQLLFIFNSKHIQPSLKSSIQYCLLSTVCAFVCLWLAIFTFKAIIFNCIYVILMNREWKFVIALTEIVYFENENQATTNICWFLHKLSTVCRTERHLLLTLLCVCEQSETATQLDTRTCHVMMIKKVIALTCTSLSERPLGIYTHFSWCCHFQRLYDAQSYFFSSFLSFYICVFQMHNQL